MKNQDDTLERIDQGGKAFIILRTIKFGENGERRLYFVDSRINVCFVYARIRRRGFEVGASFVRVSIFALIIAIFEARREIGADRAVPLTGESKERTAPFPRTSLALAIPPIFSLSLSLYVTLRNPSISRSPIAHRTCYVRLVERSANNCTDYYTR